MSLSIWEKYKKVLPITWGADWDNIQCSQLLSHNKVTSTSVAYKLATLET